MSNTSSNRKKRVCLDSDFDKSNNSLKVAIAKITESENEVKAQAYEIQLFKADTRQYKRKMEKIKRMSLGDVARDDVLLEIGNTRFEDGIVD